MTGRLVRTGGLFRCCIATLESLPNEVTEKEGERMSCLHCKAPMIYTRGEGDTAAWQWDQPPLKRKGEGDA